MELVAGAMGSLIPKLKDLLKEEYKLQTRVKDQVSSLHKELESAHAALCKVAEVPPDQQDRLVKIWARDVREASYDMEDILDTYLVRVEGSRKPNEDQESLLKRMGEKMTGLFKKSKERHKIAGAIEKISKNLQEVTDRRGRYTVDSIVAKPAESSRTVDPRLTAMYREESQIIGIDKSSADLISMLSLKADDDSSKKIKIVSVVGVGGLGKTTLAKAVYDNLKSLFGYRAFVPVGQHPDLKKVFRDILIDLDKGKYTDSTYTMWDERQLINELRDFLGKKRYFVVIDDIWEPQCWKMIKLALVGNDLGSRVIITTRKFEVAKEVDEVYRLQPLLDDNSKKLFYTRLFGGEDKCPTNHPEDLSNAILKKCGGVPLAIITMASLLLGKSRKEWYDVCNSPGFYQDKDDKYMENTIHVLSLSYYDLPSHLKSCLLYLSIFPEDTLIDKDSLIWKWIAEGFVEEKRGRRLFEVAEGSAVEKRGCRLFEVGEEYFHDLINRNMIQGVDSEVYGIMAGCRVHDMVLDLIVSKSLEEDFVIADGTLSQSHTRRLAIKNRELVLTQDTHVNLPQVRSFIVWQCAIDNKWALHPRLKLIRVLAFELCGSREGCYSLEHIGNLIHLRYLEIRASFSNNELPEGIGSLKFLQTLSLDNFGDLPCSIGRLTQLVCLHCPMITAPVGVIGKLTSLEELHIIPPHHNDESRRQFAKDLGNLCKLRVLEIHNISNMDKSMHVDLMQSIGNLENMQHLRLGHSKGSADMITWTAVSRSRDLRCLFLPDIFFPKLPSWINSAHLSSLSHLEVHVDDMDEQGPKALGWLSELCYLKLHMRSCARMTINASTDGCFQKLRSLVLPKSMVQFVANEDSGASFARNKDGCSSRVVVPAIAVMPNLEELEFHLTENNVNNSEDLGLEYLPSLRKVKVSSTHIGAIQEAALRHAIEVHPNRPALQIEDVFKDITQRWKKAKKLVQVRNEEDEEETQIEVHPNRPTLHPNRPALQIEDVFKNITQRWKEAIKLVQVRNEEDEEETQ